MPSPSGGKSGAASQFPEGRSHPPNKRKFYIVRHRVVSNTHGFILQNKEALFQGRAPIYVDPFGPRGFRDYPEVPLFTADKRRGRIHWDLEEIPGCWFISDRMKMVLEPLDPGAFAFVKCKVQLPDGSDAAVRWLCDVVRVLDALDEEKSDIDIRTATDGSKYYSLSRNFNLAFKGDVVGQNDRFFRLKYFRDEVICDEQVKLACKAAAFAGPRFEAAWVKPVFHRQ